MCTCPDWGDCVMLRLGGKDGGTEDGKSGRARGISRCEVSSRSAQISVLVGLSSTSRWFVDSSKREDAPIGGIKTPWFVMIFFTARPGGKGEGGGLETGCAMSDKRGDE